MKGGRRREDNAAHHTAQKEGRTMATARMSSSSIGVCAMAVERMRNYKQQQHQRLQ